MCFGASAHSKPQGSRGPPGWPRLPRASHHPEEGLPAHQAAGMTPSKHLQAMCGPRALHCCHKGNKEGANSVPLLCRPWWGGHSFSGWGRGERTARSPQHGQGCSLAVRLGLGRPEVWASLPILRITELHLHSLFFHTHAAVSGGKAVFQLPGHGGVRVCAEFLNNPVVTSLLLLADTYWDSNFPAVCYRVISTDSNARVWREAAVTLTAKMFAFAHCWWFPRFAACKTLLTAALRLNLKTP